MSRKSIFLLAFFLSAFAAFANPIIHHKIAVTMDPAKHRIDATDQIVIPAADIKPVIYFLLNNNLTVTSETPGVLLKLDQSGVKAEDFGMDREDFNLSPEFKQNKYALTFENKIEGDVSFTLKIGGTINYPMLEVSAKHRASLMKKVFT